MTRGSGLSREGDPEAAAYERVWVHEMQAQLARLSTSGRQIIVEKSGHRIAAEAPEVVVAAVRDVVAMVRAKRPRAK